MLVDEGLISYYFGLNRKISRTKIRVEKMRLEFYQQTMSSYCTSDEDKIFSKGFPVEKRVTALVDAQAMAKEQIELMAFKQKHFLRYLKQLPKEDRSFLRRKYRWQETCLNDRVERECYEELQEIEEAAGYRFMGYEPELPEIEIADITEESEQAFEDDFMKICGMLGV